MMGMPNPARVRCQFPLALLFPLTLVSSIEKGASADFRPPFPAAPGIVGLGTVFCFRSTTAIFFAGWAGEGLARAKSNSTLAFTFR